MIGGSLLTNDADDVAILKLKQTTRKLMEKYFRFLSVQSCILLFSYTINLSQESCTTAILIPTVVDAVPNYFSWLSFHYLFLNPILLPSFMTFTLIAWRRCLGKWMAYCAKNWEGKVDWGLFWWHRSLELKLVPGKGWRKSSGWWLAIQVGFKTMKKLFFRSESRFLVTRIADCCSLQIDATVFVSLPSSFIKKHLRRR